MGVWEKIKNTFTKEGTSVGSLDNLDAVVWSRDPNGARAQVERQRYEQAIAQAQRSANYGQVLPGLAMHPAMWTQEDEIALEQEIHNRKNRTREAQEKIFMSQHEDVRDELLKRVKQCEMEKAIEEMSEVQAAIEGKEADLLTKYKMTHGSPHFSEYNRSGGYNQEIDGPDYKRLVELHVSRTVDEKILGKE